MKLLNRKKPEPKLPDYITENVSEELIRLEDLVKIYDTGALKVLGLKRINLTIHRGEFVAIMGQSGSGKSTLMNILGCLDRPSMGHYYLDGVDVAAMNPDELSLIRNRKIGFVFQSFNLISRTSALKNVELPMTYARKGKRFREQRARILLERVGLGKRAEHMPNELSGGQRQRVAIARALANEPPLLLADEPTGNLDTAASVEIMELFSQLHKEGTTVVVVTHEEEIAAFTERIIRFRDGEIVSDSSNVRKEPESCGTGSETEKQEATNATETEEQGWESAGEPREYEADRNMKEREKLC
ncbi:MAG: ABC transporter ATP-binding protein [Lachnospiraceae bacterium]|jgi:putative ABC transport system ATP-binding protein|nr:ABC transporter ATP-binding protein [Lachnospiraceae bacterium]